MNNPTNDKVAQLAELLKGMEHEDVQEAFKKVDEHADIKRVILPLRGYGLIGDTVLTIHMLDKHGDWTMQASKYCYAPELEESLKYMLNTRRHDSLLHKFYKSKEQICADMAFAMSNAKTVEEINSIAYAHGLKDG